MLNVNQNFQTRNVALSKRPVYVAEIFFNNGNTGTDGINDVYFATCNVSEITDFPFPDKWFPFLKSDSINSLSQTVDPINGVSSIGGLDIVLTDYNGMVSDIIRAADAVGHGLRRQRISIHMLYKGMSWDDKVTIRTMQINDVRLSSLNEYKLTCADVQRQLQKTVFNPYSTTLTGAVASSGAVTLNVTDSRNFLATVQQTYGTVGFVKIGDEIMMWSSKPTDTSFYVDASGRGMFGTATAAHSIGDAVQEIVVLRENPITMALKIMQSTGTGANGTWDVYPARWGCNMDSANDVDVAEWLEVGKLLTGLTNSPSASDGIQFEFVIDKSIEAKRFIENNILKVLGAFGFVHGDGRYGVKAYADLANAVKENGILLDQNAVVKWGDLTYNYNDIANQVWIEYDENPKLSGKYIRNAIFIDDVSIRKWGQARQLKYTADGIIPTSIFASQIYQRFQRIIARYSRPPMQIELTLLPKYHTLEIGDIVRVTLPIRDLFTGASLDRAFEIISTRLTPKTGEVVIKCIAQHERATLWFGGVGSIESVTVSPAETSVVTGSTFQMVARAFDGVGVQVPTPAISWIASGNVTVDSSGLVTAGAAGSGTVYAVAGSKVSNVAQITVVATANANPVASVVVSPSSVTFEAGQTQTMTAVAYDVNGQVVEGKTFAWASDATGVATITAGPSASVTLTAVANGTANITATETVSAIASSAVVATVETPQTPTYAPPAIADSAYQIGTQLTAATHPTVISGASAPYTFVNGGDLPEGDYWIDGDVSLAAGDTITINGTVRLFCLGTVTINGTIDGKGRGGAGAAAVTATANTSRKGNDISDSAFVGKGGNGGHATNPTFVTPIYRAAQGGTVALASPQSTPVLTVSKDTLSGIPTKLYGTGGAGGAALGLWAATATGGAGGAGGAGLAIIARGIVLTLGLVDLRGNDGGNASTTFFNQNLAVGGGGGGGGGGSFVALHEGYIVGTVVSDNSSIYPNRVLNSGGAGGLLSRNDGYQASNMGENGFAGNSGAYINTFIG